MEIKVLGTGCATCNKLERIVTEALQELGLADPVQKVSDIEEMLSYGIISTPALVIDGKVKAFGRAPAKEEIKKYLQGGEGDSSGGCKCGCCSQ
jgi:small redox-active disulfide protein 2